MGEVLNDNISFSYHYIFIVFVQFHFSMVLMLSIFCLCWFYFIQEEKKTEETKTEEQKTEEPKKEEETKPEEKPEETKDEAVVPPPPPTEILLRVFLHCEGCARKVRRCLKDFPGVEDVITDCKSHMVVVKGEKADPLMVLERVQKKSHRKVELLSPIPNAPEEEKVAEEEKPAPEEEKKEEVNLCFCLFQLFIFSFVYFSLISSFKSVE